MPSVGEQLRAAREAQKLSIHQVSETTKIRTEHIRALEESEFDAFNAPVYIRGFVRTYAGLLRLDVPRVMSDLNAELSGTRKFSEPPSLTDEPRGWVDLMMLQLSRVDWRVVSVVLGLAALIAAAVFGYRAWHAHRTRDPLQSLGPGIHQSRTNRVNEYLPLPTR